MSNTKRIRIKKKTDELLKMKFPELQLGKITYDDVMMCIVITKRKKK